MTENAPRAQAWVILVISVVAQMAATVAITGPAFLIPHLSTELGYSLTQAGTIAVAPSYGLILTLIAWGAFADRFGERLAIILGITLTALSTRLALPLVGSPLWMTVLIAASGAAAASVNSASGRMIMGWFPRHRRGLAMGIRQMAPPLGTSVAALAVPPIAADHGLAGYLWFIVAVNGVMALVCVVVIRNPPHAEVVPAETESAGPVAAAQNPYRSDSFLWRIHAASALLVIPQFAFSTYGLIWLISTQSLDAGLAGGVVAASQLVGALGRMVVGGISDRVDSRVGLMRIVAVLAVILVSGVALVSLEPMPLVAGIVFILAATISVADNGLAFASVAEAAGGRWAGKALGAQNTGQFVMSAALGPGLGALITLWGYPLAFAAVALAPLLSLTIIPKRDLDRIT
ncbi:sugar phosphate permease [Brevibacterium sanguinis]|uniref:Sugar phosphate permease n=2 Tax=Brevibacterium TaxID=1696 RepID=A0A366IG22_9MICO|nr:MULTISPECIES: MFS transporter [Brevibacterium]RBP63652.1 sugar phosphate permease [Brevibacterium sanguinis]RBP70311.1 sugar phosphate permease [Brevibacterium celere]